MVIEFKLMKAFIDVRFLLIFWFSYGNFSRNLKPKCQFSQDRTKKDFVFSTPQQSLRESKIHNDSIKYNIVCLGCRSKIHEYQRFFD